MRDFRMRVGFRKGLVVVTVSMFAFWVDSMSAANLFEFIFSPPAPSFYRLLTAWFLASMAIMTVLRAYYALHLPVYLTEGKVSIDKSKAREWILALAIFGIPIYGIYTIMLQIMLRSGLYLHYGFPDVLTPLWMYYYYHRHEFGLVSFTGTIIQEPLRALMFTWSRITPRRTLPAISLVGVNTLIGFLVTFPYPQTNSITPILVLLYWITLLVESFLLKRYWRPYRDYMSGGKAKNTTFVKICSSDRTSAFSLFPPSFGRKGREI